MFDKIIDKVISDALFKLKFEKESKICTLKNCGIQIDEENGEKVFVVNVNIGKNSLAAAASDQSRVQYANGTTTT